jgi:hypothetical protein
MTDRPMLFSAPMVKGLLREIEAPGTGKTQTRRIMKPQPIRLDNGGWHIFSGGGGIIIDHEQRVEDFAPHQIDDRIWVKETWCTEERYNHLKPSDICPGEWIGYRAGPDDLGHHGKPRVSIFMPRWASRITLTVTDVRVQRLQDISEEDAIAEGIQPLFSQLEIVSHPGCNLTPMPWTNYLWHGRGGQGISTRQSENWPHQYSSYSTATGSYSSLWTSINSPGSWEANPWVAAYTFTPELRNIDQLEMENG